MKRFIVTIVLFACIISVKAQEIREQVKEDIKAQRVAFITSKLQLTVDEAQKFWPLYNEYCSKVEKVFDQRRSLMHNYRTNKSNLRDKELEKIADEFVNLEMTEAKLLQEYHSKFKEVLPIDKVILLYQAEYKFKNHLLKQIREKGKGKQGMDNDQGFRGGHEKGDLPGKEGDNF